jgi:glycosyltransferase involved in cell wall biosynthesis
MKILVLPRHAELGASSRLRLLQYLPWFERANFQVEVASFFSDELLSAKYAQGKYSVLGLLAAYSKRIARLMQRHNFDLVWIEKEALPWLPASLEVALLRGVPYVLDFDDATFHNYDIHPSSWVRRLMGHRIDHLMAHSAMTVVGNQYLAARATSAGAKVVEVIPTVIDLDRYPLQGQKNQTSQSSAIQRIVWIGSPTTAKYLSLIAAPLKELAQTHKFVLRVIGAEVEISGIDVELCPWSASTEADLISECDVGIMPLLDTPWEQGKCGYKLIQYMACGLPVVASPIGANLDIVKNGANGYLASSPQEWLTALQSILNAPQACDAMGQAGRHDVESRYCIQKTAPAYIGLLNRTIQDA